METDVLIVGGGITGAALAYLAAHASPALRVTLIERGELACGTSSRSSRLLHGGFRYLAQGRLGLVRRLLLARRELAALVPALVWPAPFLMPLGAGGPAAWRLRAAGRLYRWLGTRQDAPVELLDPEEARRREPLIGGDRLTGALSFEELATDDAALVRALAGAAAAAGVTVRTHTMCEALRPRGDGRIRALLWSADRSTSLLDARVVVNATGAWCDDLLRGGAGARGGAAGIRSHVRLSRGSHVVLSSSRLPLGHTVVFFSPRDGRPLFASPRGDEVLVGTTEVEHLHRPDDVRPSPDEVAYLVESVAAAFPSSRLGDRDVLGAFAGVRPLAAARSGNLGALDRRYVLHWDAPGLLSIRGGKLALGLDGARRALRALSGRCGLPVLHVPPRGALPTVPARFIQRSHPFTPRRAA